MSIISNIGNNLPVLQVVIPLICAALCAAFKDGKKAWVIATLAIFASFIVSLTLFIEVSGSDYISYALGGHKPPIGIEYRLDTLNIFVLLLVSFISLIMMPYAYKSVEHEIPKNKIPLFYSMYLLCFAGLLGITSTNDIFNIYVFLEISSLSMYTLIAMGKDRRALTASFEYLILGTIGATFILIGIGLLYIMTGSLNITDIASRLANVADPRPIEAALAFITLGLGMKMALFPLHIWLANSYAYSPSFISAFLSSTATKVSLYVLIRLLYTMFGYEYGFNAMSFGIVLIILAVAGIFVGSLTAIYQPNVKRMLAFSSVAQMGYIALGLGLATEAGLVASLAHLVNHAFAKGLLFLAVGAVFMRTGGITISYFAGIAKYMPLTMAAFIVGGFSLIGIPFTAGFISKWYLLQAIIDEGMWYLVILLLLSSIMAVIYIWKVIEAAYFQERPSDAIAISEAPRAMLISMGILAFANIYFGIDTTYTIGTAIDIARSLTEVL